MPDLADQNDRVPWVLEILGGDMRFFFDQSDHRNRRSWIDYTSRTLIIQRDVATDDRCVERTANLRHSFNGFAELPEIFGFMRIAEIQVICHSQRGCTGTS